MHLNRNKTNYKSSLGMGIGVASDDRRQNSPYIIPVTPPSVKELVETHISLDSTDHCRQVSGT